MSERLPPVARAGFRSGFVVLAGRPNVGKSTLLNRLVGSKVSVVSPIPQTTRLVIRAVAQADDSQIIFLDTPGFSRPRYRMNREMMRSAREALDGVDLILLIVDGPEGLGPGDSYMFHLLSERSVPACVVINKIDAMPRPALLPLMDELSKRGSWEAIIPCSALTGENCDDLRGSIVERLPEGPPLFPPDFLTDLPARLALAERVREQVLLRTREEIPHATTVIVDRFEKTPKGEYRVGATIYVDRETQKGILIGKRGEMLKSIGTSARAEMTDYLGAPAHLSLWVKVKRGWRNDALILRLLGITPAR